MLKIKLFNPQTNEAQTIVVTPETTTKNVYLIGRGTNCDLMLDSVDVSRTHGKIEFLSNEYHYSDLGSANGSYINNTKMKPNQNRSLKANDRISIGDFMLVMEAIDSPAEKPQSGGNRPTWKDNLTVRCVRITDETSDVKTFTFVAEPAVLFDYKPGQFVTLELKINGEEILRSYSISSSPTRPHSIEITVKRVPPPTATPQAPAGLVSTWLHDNLKVGSQVKLSSPLGKFTCCPKPAQKLLMISAGSGITPMISMSRWLADTVSETDIVFFHSTRTASDIIFRQELELMAARLPNFRFAIALTQFQLGQPWFGFTGRLTEVMLQTIASDFLDRTVYVCGSSSFMESVKTMLKQLNFPMQNYYEESFGAPKKAKEAAKVEPSSIAIASPQSGTGTRAIVHFSQSQKEAESDGTESILDLAEQVGVKIRSNCKQGICGACKKRKLEGTVRYDSEPDGLEESDKEAGFVLTCVASAIDRVVVEA